MSLKDANSVCILIIKCWDGNDSDVRLWMLDESELCELLSLGKYTIQFKQSVDKFQFQIYYLNC